MSALLEDVPEVLTAYEEYRRFSADPVMREKVKARQRFLDEQMIIMNDVWEEGEAKGMVKGEAKKARETAIAMKTKGYPIADIADITGLPSSEIERLG
jgi:predicted transposase/invertase (TIGR01784 family)